MTIPVRPGPEGLVVRPEGPLDAAAARIFREEIGRWHLPRSTTVVVDLDRVPFVDSSGISALLGLRKRVAANQGRIVLRNVPDQVRRVLRVTRLDGLFPAERDAAA